MIFMSSGSKYVTRVTAIIPARATLPARMPSVYVGVSVGNPNFKGERLEALLGWIEQCAERCRLVVGKKLSRWSVMVGSGASEETATLTAAAIGDQQIARLRRALAALEDSTKFDIVTDDELRGHTRFLPLLSELSTLDHDNSKFAQLVSVSARQYCDDRRRRGQRIAVDFELAVRLSRNFILEELALYGVLVASGSPIEIYPGPELPVLVAIANGELAGAPRELIERTNLVVELTPLSLEEAA